MHSMGTASRLSRRLLLGPLVAVLCAAAVTACGGASDAPAGPRADAPTTAPSGPTPPPPTQPPSGAPTPTPSAPPTPQPSAPPASPPPAPGPAPLLTIPQAVRLLNQSTFGPSEALIAEVQSIGAREFVVRQFDITPSRYRDGGDNGLHRWLGETHYCDQFTDTGYVCRRDSVSSIPVLRDFYQHAIGNRDQLRQRVAFALAQILVVSDLAIEGTYGFRAYQQMLRDHAFGNYRSLLEQVILSPLMGVYLNHVGNPAGAPNENFARELLQLFSIGPCLLEADGALTVGRCQPTYSNAVVREYAFALTGYGFPQGGRSWWCPDGTNCAWPHPTYLLGSLEADPAQHDRQPRQLLGGSMIPAGRNPTLARERVLDSLMQHQNLAPNIAQQLIRFLVTSNPSPEYVRRVAAAFSSGLHDGLGSGVRGDLKATVAAILLDPEARSAPPATAPTGMLREPALLFTAIVRALHGRADGEAFGYWLGEALRQRVFAAPTVFNFYPADFQLPGAPELRAPQFGIEDSNTSLQRIALATWVAYHRTTQGNVVDPDPTVPNAKGLRVDLAPFETDADDVGRLLDRLSMLLLGETLQGNPRLAVEEALLAWQPGDAGYRSERVRTAVFLLLASPQFHVVR
jgi:uncharacterized protein (DUF1800 family)